ncbi:uncharacterized protein LOC114673032 [Macaca mulatta]
MPAGAPAATARRWKEGASPPLARPRAAPALATRGLPRLTGRKRDPRAGREAENRAGKDAAAEAAAPGGPLQSPLSPPLPSHPQHAARRSLRTVASQSKLQCLHLRLSQPGAPSLPTSRRLGSGAENGKGRVQAASPEPRGRAGLRAGPEGRAGSWVLQPRPLFPASRSPQPQGMWLVQRLRTQLEPSRSDWEASWPGWLEQEEEGLVMEEMPVVPGQEDPSVRTAFPAHPLNGPSPTVGSTSIQGRLIPSGHTMALISCGARRRPSAHQETTGAWNFEETAPLL